MTYHPFSGWMGLLKISISVGYGCLVDLTCVRFTFIKNKHSCFRKAYFFAIPHSGLILTSADASFYVALGQDEEDVLNEVRIPNALLFLRTGSSYHLRQISLSDTKKYLAFSTDAGTVGVMELPTKHITRTKVSHTSVHLTSDLEFIRLISLFQICASVKFIPDRPNELISGGYDHALLHFDFKQGTVLSRFDIGKLALRHDDPILG